MSAILRAGGKRRFDPEALGAGGRRRELQGMGAAAAPASVCPSAPPCSPCICGSEHGAGYCLKELAEFPVLVDRGGSQRGPRAEGMAGKGAASGPRA